MIEAFVGARCGCRGCDGVRGRKLGYQTALAVEVVRCFAVVGLLHAAPFTIISIRRRAAVRLGDLIFGVKGIVMQAVIGLVAPGIIRVQRVSIVCVAESLGADSTGGKPRRCLR